jgi:hypothetical protein
VHTEQRQVSSWSMTTDFDHAATVRKDNQVYPVGTTLENRSAYFSSITPVLDTTVAFEYAASNDGNITASAETWLKFQRVSRDRNGNVETVYWQMSRELERERATGLEPGEQFRVPVAVNVSRLANRSERIEDQLGRTQGQTEAIVRATVEVNGTVNGAPVSRSEQHALPVEVGEVYGVRDPGAATEQFSSTRAVTVTNTYGPLRRFGAPLVVVLSLGFLAGLAVARHRGALEVTDREREYLAYRDDRSDFDEWINRIRLPPAARTSPRAEAESLADLVDFAIDTDNSVIEDPKTGTYHVVKDDRHYVYDPPSPIRDESLDFTSRTSLTTQTIPDSEGIGDDATPEGHPTETTQPADDDGSTDGDDPVDPADPKEPTD